MKNYKITMSFDGSRYRGWEHQPGTDMTIQGKIENVLAKMTGTEVEVLGAGRTDAGVHAMGMVASCRMDAGDMTPAAIRDYMNRYLPEDICILSVKEASDRFHARYNAVGKTYCYTCYAGSIKPVFDRKYVCKLDDITGWMPGGTKVRIPDVESMRRAASYLTGTHDFAGFCSNPRMKKSTVRTVDSINIERNGDYIRFTYHGTGFLQHMVRILTGTLLEVGFGKRDAESIPSLIEAKDRKQSGFTAPACGLCLMEVEY